MFEQHPASAFLVPIPRGTPYVLGCPYRATCTLCLPVLFTSGSELAPIPRNTL